MILWRISRHVDLSGTGGLRIDGRWHHMGRPIVYLATSPAAALLEVCVHTSANDIPPRYTLLKITAPEDLSRDRIDPQSVPEDWQSLPNLTRDLGTKWLKSNVSVLLEVPSAIIPETTNMLLNPLHPQAVELAIVDSRGYPFDLRIKQ